MYVPFLSAPPPPQCSNLRPASLKCTEHLEKLIYKPFIIDPIIDRDKRQVFKVWGSKLKVKAKAPFKREILRAVPYCSKNGKLRGCVHMGWEHFKSCRSVPKSEALLNA